MAHADEKPSATGPIIAPTVTIIRHAAQAILHHALDLQPEICCGLLYGLSDETGISINRAMPVANRAAHREQACAFDEKGIARTLSSDREKASDLIGLYRSFPLPGTTTADMLSGIPSLLPDAATGQLYAAVSLCTEGRLEIHAFTRVSGEWREQTLHMVEDNALYHMRHSG